MKYARRRTPRIWATVALFLGLTALAVGTATTASAYPTKTSACTGCHGTTAAGKVVATQTANDGTTATYSVALSGFPAGDPVGWALLNGTTNVAHASLATGSFSMPVGATYTLWAADPNDGAVSVSVHPVAVTPPAKVATSLTLNGTTSSVNGSPLALTATLTGPTPLAGKTVTLSVSTNGGSTYAAAGTGVTDANGKFTFAPTASNGWMYKASFAGDAGYLLSESTPVTVSVTVVKTATVLTMGGTFNSLDGAPLAITGSLTASGLPRTATPVALLVSKDGGATWTQDSLGMTNAAGGVSFAPVTAAGWMYKLSFAGDASYAASESAPQTATVTVSPKVTSLTMGGTFTSTDGSPLAITGRLVAGSANVAGKTVTLMVSKNGEAFAAAGTAVTDASGNVSFAPVPSAGWSYKLSFAGDAAYVASESTSQAVTVIVSPKPTTLTMGGTFSAIEGSPLAITGKLVNGSASVAGKTVTLLVSKSGGTFTSAGTAVTDASGNVAFAPVASDGWAYKLSFAGDATYVASESAPQSAIVTAPAAKATALVMGGTFTAETGSPLAITGHLTAGSVDVAGKTVTLLVSKDGGVSFGSDGTAVTNAAGGVSFAPVASDGWFYKLSYAGDAAFIASESATQVAVVTTPAVKADTALTIGGTLASTDGSPLSISGILSSADGAVSGQTVSLQVSKDGGSTFAAAGTAATDASGRVAFVPAASNGWSYRLSFAGSTTLNASVSSAVTVSVMVTPPAAGVVLAAPALSVAAPAPGKAFVFTTVATPAAVQAKVSFTVYMKDSQGRWHRVRVLAGHQGSNGVFASNRASFGKGTYRVVATYAGTNGKATSTTVTFTVKTRSEQHQD